MAVEIDFEIGHFHKFDGPVTSTSTSDDLESHIFVNVLSTPTNIKYGLVVTWSLIVDVRKYVRTDKRMEGHLIIIRMSHLC